MSYRQTFLRLHSGKVLISVIETTGYYVGKSMIVVI